MKKIYNLTLLTIFSFLLVSCATTSQYVKFPKKEIDSSQSRIIVMRPSFFGSAIKFNIYQNDVLIGKLGPTSYISWDIPQREIRLKSSGENKEIMTINPSPGKIYYIKQEVKMGFVVARSSLIQISKEEGERMLKKLNKPKVNYIE
jgi:hypothetical protein